jgi:hypothetical protein
MQIFLLESTLLLFEHHIVVAVPHEVFHCLLRSLQLLTYLLLALLKKISLFLYFRARVLLLHLALRAHVHPLRECVLVGFSQVLIHLGLCFLVLLLSLCKLIFNTGSSRL